LAISWFFSFSIALNISSDIICSLGFFFFIEKFDNDYLYKLMEQELDVILQLCQDQVVHKEVCNEELLKAARKLHTNKAADYFGITAENVINGSELLLNYLQNLINLSFKNCHIPDILN
jgi:hypothetical protein